MSSCTFFGHRDVPASVAPLLRAALTELIEKQQVNMFYVGNHGGFDLMVRQNLHLAKQLYPHIDYAVVLAYLPGKTCTPGRREAFPTLYPEGLETVPPRFAILKRNEWMIEQAEHVVTYVRYSIGGAARAEALARAKGRHVHNLALLTER